MFDRSRCLTKQILQKYECIAFINNFIAVCAEFYYSKMRRYEYFGAYKYRLYCFTS